MEGPARTMSAVKDVEVDEKHLSTTSQTLSVSDIKHLQRVVDDIPPRLWAVAVIGFWERFAFWGMTAPWRSFTENYMENGRHGRNGAPGALGLGQAMATRMYCAFYIFYYVSPLLFAIVSDSYLGRFKTLCISALLYVLGCLLLVGTSLDVALDAGLGLPGLAVTMVLVALGGGGFKMLMIPFVADQYTPKSTNVPKLKTLRTGERVMVDSSLTLQYIYNMYYWVGNVGSLSWFGVTLIEKYYSFTIAYSMTSAAMVIAMFMLFLGAKSYVRLPHKGNILSCAAKILACACRNSFKMARADPEYQLQHCGKRVTWSAQLVKELRRGLRACRVLMMFVVFYVCFDQMQNNLISQAKQMETNAIPNDFIPGLNQVACIFLGPIVQYGLYPFLNKRRIHFKPIARITVGFGFIALSMLYALVLQHFIYSAPPCYQSPGNCQVSASSDKWRGPNQINVWLQTPVYVFMAIGEIFAMVTAMEYAYEHSPEHLKAIVQAINSLVAGLGSGCAMALTPIARDPHLLILYGTLTGAMTLTTALFWWRFSTYDKHDADSFPNGDEIDLPEAGMIPMSASNGNMSSSLRTIAVDPSTEDVTPDATASEPDTTTESQFSVASTEHPPSVPIQQGMESTCAEDKEHLDTGSVSTVNTVAANDDDIEGDVNLPDATEKTDSPTYN